MNIQHHGMHKNEYNRHDLTQKSWYNVIETRVFKHDLVSRIRGTTLQINHISRTYKTNYKYTSWRKWVSCIWIKQPWLQVRLFVTRRKTNTITIAFVKPCVWGLLCNLGKKIIGTNKKPRIYACPGLPRFIRKFYHGICLVVNYSFQELIHLLSSLSNVICIQHVLLVALYAATTTYLSQR